MHFLQILESPHAMVYKYEDQYLLIIHTPIRAAIHQVLCLQISSSLCIISLMYVLKSITEFKTYTAHLKYWLRLRVKGSVF